MIGGAGLIDVGGLERQAAQAAQSRTLLADAEGELQPAAAPAGHGQPSARPAALAAAILSASAAADGVWLVFEEGQHCSVQRCDRGGVTLGRVGGHLTVEQKAAVARWLQAERDWSQKKISATPSWIVRRAVGGRGGAEP